MGSCIILFHTLLIIFQMFSCSNGRQVPGHDSLVISAAERGGEAYHANGSGTVYDNSHFHPHSPAAAASMDPAVLVFLNIDDIQLGKKMPVYFPVKDPSKSPRLLSREEVETLPFSSEKLPSILNLLSFSKDSPQARAMKSTLSHCEVKPLNGETKFCATSLESLLDSVYGFFGSQYPKLKVLTTNYLTEDTSIIVFQNYTISEPPPKEIRVPTKMIACHTMPYPYVVYYCHSQESQNKLFKISLLGDNGARVDSLAVCHMDTSQWSPDHAAFRVLRIEPGKAPVCHFVQADNLVWVPSVPGSM